MVSTKQIKTEIATVVAALIISASMSWLHLATLTANAISEEQAGAVIQNCDSIKQTLVKLQHSDSRTRTYLGSSYEMISGRFITPLNLRLVKNNLTISELFKIQNDFSSAQADFRNSYVDYMRELEGLIATSCTEHPDEFYDKLVTVRAKREDLRKVTKKLSELTDQQYKSVEELRASLQK